MEAPESSLAEGGVSDSWKQAEGIFTPQKQNTGISTVNQFRTISLLNVEGKYSSPYLQKGLHLSLQAIFILIIDTSIQKGGVPWFSGRLEHSSATTQLIGEAKEGREVFTVVWLDSANAYGSILRQLIYKALHSVAISEFPNQFTTN